MKLSRSCLHLFVPVILVKRLLKVSGSWEGSEDEIDAVCRASELGQAFFGAAAAKNISSRVGKTIERCIRDVFPNGSDITAAGVDTFNLQCEEALRSMPLTALPKNRTCFIPFEGQRIQIPISSPATQQKRHLAAFLKTEAAAYINDTDRKPVLTELFCLKDLLPGDFSRCGSMDLTLLNPFNRARKNCNKMLPMDRQSNHVHIADPSGMFR